MRLSASITAAGSLALGLLATVAAVIAVPVDVISPYEKVDWRSFGHHRAALHVHTLQSDGYHSVNEVVRTYRAAGFSILALTDHDRTAPNDAVRLGRVPPEEASRYPEEEPPGFPANTTWPWTDFGGPSPGDLGMIAIEGNELSSGAPTTGHHINSFFTGYGVPHRYALPEDYQLEAVARDGGVAIMNHPGYRPGRLRWPVEWYLDRFERNDCLIGMEITTGGYYDFNAALWDQLLARLMPDRPVWGFGNDDMHRLERTLLSYTVFLLDELSEASVREAMETGRFYFVRAPGRADLREGASVFEDLFPRLHAIDIDRKSGRIMIDASDYDEIRWITNPPSGDLIADYRTSDQPWEHGRIIHQGASLNYLGSPGVGTYLRVELIRNTPQGKARLFTNPIAVLRDRDAPPSARTSFALERLGRGEAPVRRWTNPRGGRFRDAGHWSPPGVPEPAEDLVFALEADRPYRVRVEEGSNVAANRMLVRRGEVELDVGGNELRLTDATWIERPQRKLTGLSVAPVEGDRASLHLGNGELITEAFVAGGGERSSGGVTLSGSGTRWTSRGVAAPTATFGLRGAGTLMIENGALADLKWLGFAEEPGSRAKLSLRGDGSRLSAQRVYAAHAGIGGLEVTDGALFEIVDGLGFLNLGTAKGGEGRLTVRNASVRVGERIYIGRDGGSGFLEIVDRGRVETLAHDIRLGRFGGSGVLRIGDGSVVEVARNLAMATGFDPADEASAILEMIGTDSRLVVGEHLLVAYNGRSTVSVRDGSLEVGGEFRPFGGGTGTINFSNARVSVGDRVRFGQFAGGKGVLTLDDNTDLTSGRIDPVGEAEETDAKVVLKGGSTWFARSGGGNTRIGNSRGASGAIVIEEGSRLRIEGHSLFFIGAARGAVGEISVGGVGSTLEGKALSIFVGGREQGARGEGSLMVADRGGIHIGDDLVIWGNGSLNVNGGRIYARRLRFSDEGAVLNVTLGDCDGPFLGIVEDIHLGHRARLRVRVAGGRKIVPGDEFVLARYGGSLSGGFGGMHDGNLLRAGDHEFEINYGTGTDDSISLVAIEPQNS